MLLDKDTLNALVKDTMVLDQICDLMSDREWSADTLDAIADLVRISGRIINDLDK